MDHPLESFLVSVIQYGANQPRSAATWYETQCWDFWNLKTKVRSVSGPNLKVNLNWLELRGIEYLFSSQGYEFQQVFPLLLFKHVNILVFCFGLEFELLLTRWRQDAYSFFYLILFIIVDHLLNLHNFDLTNGGLAH